MGELKKSSNCCGQMQSWGRASGRPQKGSGGQVSIEGSTRIRVLAHATCGHSPMGMSPRLWRVTSGP